ncbi:MAG: hypothetical protein ACREND_14805 [Gemmatimonadaceae bacterium]
MKASLLIVLCAIAFGCHVGERVEDFKVAHEPTGTSAEVIVASGTIMRAELLAVSDSNIVVLWSGTVIDVPYGHTKLVSIETPNIRLEHGAHPSADQLERLRLISRFPQGMSPELQARLLAAYHQNAIGSVNQ